MSKFPSLTANNSDSITAFARAGSVKPVRKTVWKFWKASSSVILKTGSEAFLALPMFVESQKTNSRPLWWISFLPSSSSICSRELSTGSVPNGSIALADNDGINAGGFTKFDSLISAVRFSFRSVTRKLRFDSCSSNRFALRACLTACDLAERFAPRSCLL